ncbi:hypothetical protein WHI96_12760 [Pseudonocardia tropica]|uniref:DUF4386 family protein n=1 Tax=Pseudonocardia tropica TaxID=681289 RepID=A0ABV1JUS4_9PSEU
MSTEDTVGTGGPARPDHRPDRRPGERAAPVRTGSPVPGGAVAAVAGALVLTVCNVLSGLYPQSGSTRDAIAWFAGNAGLVEAVAATGLLAVFLLVPGVWAVVHRLRAPVLAAAGGWLMGTGYLASVVLSVETLTVLSLLAADADPGLLATASDEHAPATAVALYVVFGLGALVGTLLLGVAVLRSGGPVWAGWALVASPVVRMAGLFLGVPLVGPPLASLLIAAAFAGVLYGPTAAHRG